MLKKINPPLLVLSLLILGFNSIAIKVNSKNTFANVAPRLEFSKLHQDDQSVIFLRSFFKWYRTKYDYLDHHIYFVDMDPKNNSPYRINFKKTDEYLSILKSSGFFSESYINHKRDYFRKIDATLQKTKQNDGVVDGLDYDLIIHTQEPESILEDLSNIRLRFIGSATGKTIVRMQTPFDRDTYSLFHLKSINGKYVIDKVDFFIAGKIQN